MKEILFRAKGRDGEGWKEGYYWRTEKTTYCFAEDYDSDPENTEHYLLFDQMTDWGLPNQKFKMDIDPKTLCRFTGLVKNGKRIWENDIIKCHFGEEYAPIRYGTYQNCFDSPKSEHVGFYVDWADAYRRKDLGYWINMIDTEIVGNVFDNPELLKQE